MLEFIDSVINNKNNVKYITQGSLIGFICFIFYLELSPKLGNIWYRYSSSGERELQPESLLHMLSYPFKDTLFWKPENWDLNFLVVSGLSGATYTLLMNGIDFLL